MTERRPRTERLVFDHAADPRQRPPEQLRRCRRVLAGVLAGCALIGFPAVAPPTPRLLWNASASAPLGLYRVMPGAPLARGDWVVAWAPSSARAFAAARHYLPDAVPLVKRVRATAGDRVCASSGAILINGQRGAKQRIRDRAGRPMPSWRGCVTLANGQLFLLNDPTNSFDGRYFGPTRPDDVVGKANPLWLR